jgi:uncharacterized membrane protein YdjX (TVP38/TMEM64 family)
MSNAARRHQLLGYLALLLGLFVLTFYFRDFLWQQVLDYYSLLSTKEQIRALVASWGPWGPLVYILLQAIQVVLAPIPGETTGGFVSGFLFGNWLGLLYSMIGLTLGSVMGFLIGRWFGVHVVGRRVSPEVMDRFRFLMERQGALVSLLLFALPYFPKDYLCIILGLSGMPLKVFLVAVMVGRFPATLLFTLKGAHLYEGDYQSLIVLVGIFLGLAVVLFLFRETIYRWLTRLAEP